MPAAIPSTPSSRAPNSALPPAASSFAALLFYIGDVEALGLKVAQGLVLTETFYWDVNDSTRAWSKRWQAERPGKFPNMNQAGDYSATLHYLKAIAALKSTADGKAEVAKMKEMPTDDPVFGKGYDPRRRPQNSSGLSVRGEKARRIEISGR